MRVNMLMGMSSGGAVAVPLESEAQAWVTGVEAADAQALDAAIKTAVNNFVVQGKVDGWFTLLDACVLQAGPGTLAGTRVPLVGPVPTDFNLTAGDYDSATGLKGNIAAGAYRATNYQHQGVAGSLNNKHFAFYVSEADTTTNGYLLTEKVNSSSTGVTGSLRSTDLEIRCGGTPRAQNQPDSGFLALSCGPSNSILSSGGVESTLAAATTDFPSATPGYYEFGRSTNNGADLFSDMRCSYYSLGRHIDLATMTLYRTRVATLVAAINAALP